MDSLKCRVKLLELEKCKVIKKMKLVNPKHYLKETNEQYVQDEYMEGNEPSNKTQSVSDDDNEMDLFHFKL